jgi:hypothetical protein
VTADTIISALTLATVVLGGLWAYYRLYKRREHVVRLDFTVDVRFIGVQNDQWLVSLDAHVNNEGLVRHEITKFEIDLRCLLNTDPLVASSDVGGQVVVPHVLLRGSGLPPDWTMTHRARSQDRVLVCLCHSGETSFVLLHGYLDYRNGAHTAELLAAVPTSHQ